MATKKSLQPQTKEKVRVVCRVRPQNQKELNSGGSLCVRLSETSIEVKSDEGQYTFSFDRVFGPESTQVEVFEYSAIPMIHDVLSGYNATIFAYGQTSSGKTFTMEGSDIRDEVYRGIIPRTVEALFNGVSEADEFIEFTFKVSYVEIYMEKIRDLLDVHRVKTNLAVREDKTKGIYIAGVTEEYVTSHEELLNFMATGAENRATAATGMNEGSSRSHSVFTITVSQTNNNNATSKSGKLVLVDLAGSEMVRKTNASGQQLEEAKTINKSLSALGQVIMALTDEKANHIPYRDSKLTRILQDSLGGNSKTVLIVACSPSSYNANETVSTLRFGTRAKSIENKVIINQVRSVEELEELLVRAERAIDAQQAHIMSMAAALAAKESVGDDYRGGGADPSVIVQLQQTIVNLSQELEEEREESSRTRMESEKLVILLDEKERLLLEAGELMQEAQRHYEAQKERAESLQNEAFANAGEVQGLKSTFQSELEKAFFDLEEIKATKERLEEENFRMKKELAELSGDSPVGVRGGTGPRGGMEAGVAADEGFVPTISNPIIKSDDKHRDESHGDLKSLDIEGRHEALEDSRRQLYELLFRLGITNESAAFISVVSWSEKAFEEQERWFKRAEERFAVYERATVDHNKKVREMEVQRSRLEKDLLFRTERYMQVQAEMDNLRSMDIQPAAELLVDRERAHMKSLQQRLEQLVAVHRQLLRKFASLELENGELRKKIQLRDERIRQLETNTRALTSNLRVQTERQVGELANLREQIQSLRTEHQNKLEVRPSENSHSGSGPRTVRGGGGGVAETPRTVRGGGGAKPANSLDAGHKSRDSTGLFSRLLGPTKST